MLYWNKHKKIDIDDNDYLVYMAGSNDVTNNEAYKSLWNLELFLKMNSEVKWIFHDDATSSWVDKWVMHK